MSALKPVHPTGAGFVVTTSHYVARQVQLPNGFEFLDLGEIIRWVGDRLIVDRAIFDSRVQSSQGATPRLVLAPRQDRKEPRRLDYREVVRWKTYSRITRQIEAGQKRLNVVFIVGAQRLLGRVKKSQQPRRNRRWTQCVRRLG